MPTLRMNLVGCGKLYIGCDLGSNGGFVVLDENGKVKAVFKMPEERSEFLARLAPFSGKNSMCILEKVHSQPKNGVKASFTQGKMSERTMFAMEVSKIPFQEVTPQTWMKTFMLKKEKSETQTEWKNRLKARAQQLFPQEVVALWNADAFLIALYALRNYK